MPRADQLPPDLAPLARRNAVELSDSRWAFDVERLLMVLGQAKVDEPGKVARRSLPSRLASASFWTSLPGLLTALATLLSATVGIIALRRPDAAAPSVGAAASTSPSRVVYQRRDGTVADTPLFAEGISVQDFTVSARVYNPRDAVAHWSYGFNFRIHAQGLYALILSSDNTAFLRSQRDGQLTDLVVPFPLKHWSAEPARSNDVVLTVQDARVTLEINGQPEATIDLPDASTPGAIQLMANYFDVDQQDTAIRFESLTIQALD